MSDPTPPPRDPADTLDLIKEASWRFWVRHKHIPYSSDERALFESVVGQVWTMILSEVRPGQAAAPTSDRTKLALAVVTLLLGAGIPGWGAVQGQWTMAGVGAGAFLLGVVLTALVPWGRKQ